MKKLTATLLALLMMAMPFAGLADSLTYMDDALAAGRRLTTTIDCALTAESLTGTPEVDQVIADLVNALQITVAQQGNEGEFVLGLKQASGEVATVMSFGAAQSGSDLYLASNLLGSTIVIGAEEVVPVLERLVDLLAMLDMFSAEEAAEMKAMLAEMKAVVEAEMNGLVAAAPEFDLSKVDLSALEGVLAKMMEKIAVENVTMQPKNCDPAAVVASITMTPAEMNELLVAVLNVVKANPDLTADFAEDFMAGFNASAGTQYTFNDLLDMLIAELPNEQIYAGDVTMRIWMDENSAVCAMEAVAPMDEETSMTFNYNRLTLNEGVAHTGIISVAGVDLTVSVLEQPELLRVTAAMAEQGVTYINVQADIVDRVVENAVDCDVTISIDVNMGSDVDYVYDEAAGEWTFVETEPEMLNIGIAYADDVAINGVDFNETEVITLSVAGMEILRFNAATVTSDAAVSMTAGDVVRLAQLSDSDFAAWFVGIYNGLGNWVINVINSLPASVTNLLMSVM